TAIKEPSARFHDSQTSLPGKHSVFFHPARWSRRVHLGSNCSRSGCTARQLARRPALLLSSHYPATWFLRLTRVLAPRPVSPAANDQRTGHVGIQQIRREYQ